MKNEPIIAHHHLQNRMKIASHAEEQIMSWRIIIEARLPIAIEIAAIAAMAFS